MQSAETRLVRMPEVFNFTGEKKSAFYAKAAAGLMPKPIKIGSKITAIPEYELRAVNAARIRGASESELRALVADLHARRALIA